MSEHKEMLKKLHRIVKEGHAAMYLIKRTQSKKPEKMREVLKVDMEGEVAKIFQNVLDAKIENLIGDGENKFKDFFSENTMPEDILVISNINLIPTLPHLISHIAQHSNLNSVREFDEKTIKNLYSYAIEISLDENKKLIYFRKYTKGSRMCAKSTWILKLRNGTFDKLDGDVFKFDEYIDSIYYKCGGKVGMYVTNDKNFEEIFAFMDMYKEESEKAYEVLKSSGFVVIDERLFDEIKEKKKYIKQIALLNRRDEFNNLDFQRIEIIYNRAKNLQFKIEDGKITICDKESLKDFLDVCEKNILQDPIDETTLYRTKNKEKI